MTINRLDYCQFLLSSTTNYTMTYFADYKRCISHDSVNRLLHRDKLSGQIIWKHVKGDILSSLHGCLVFDDSALDKSLHYNKLPRSLLRGSLLSELCQ